MQIFIKKFNLSKVKDYVVKHRIRTGIAVVAVLVLLFLGWRFFGSKNQQPQYQTAQATRGTLVVSLAESGQIVSTGNLPAKTQASGIVSAVLVKNGDTVTQGQEIMDITPDQDTIQAQTQAMTDYNTAATNKATAQAQLEKDRQAVITASSDVTNVTNNRYGTNPTTKQQYTQNDVDVINSTVTSARETFAADEKKYVNADTTISVASQTVQQLSTKVVAPDSGVINNLTYAPGMAISGGTQTVTTGTGGSSSTSNARSTSTIAMILTDANTTPAATFNLSEVDAPKIQEGQRATITLDAFPGKTFTGKVIGVNREGAVSSGVTNYPVTIQLDNGYPNMSPNMSATANIIINTKADVLLVPTAAIQTSNGQSIVRVLKNGTIIQAPVTIGEASDTQTEITEGLNEGDTVVVGFVASQSSGTTGTSPFTRSLFGGNGSFGGGGLGGSRGGATRGQ